MSMRATMIVRHGKDAKSPAMAYTLISSKYQTQTFSADDLAKKIANKEIEVSNLAIEKGKIVSTNGQMSNYTFIFNGTGQVVGKATGVILDRVEKNDKLIGYTLFDPSGILRSISIAEAVDLCNKRLIANGKIRHTDAGDIVSSIKGDYPIREIAPEKAPKGDVTMNVLYFGMAGAKNLYFGAIVDCTSAERMNELIRVLTESNKKVIERSLEAADGKDEFNSRIKDSCRIQRINANSIYGVFELKYFDKIRKLDSKFSLRDKTPVSSVRYIDDVVEARAMIDKSGKVVEVGDCDDKVAKNSLKAYVGKLAEILNQ